MPCLVDWSTFLKIYTISTLPCWMLDEEIDCALICLYVKYLHVLSAHWSVHLLDDSGDIAGRVSAVTEKQLKTKNLKLEYKANAVVYISTSFVRGRRGSNHSPPPPPPPPSPLRHAVVCKRRFLSSSFENISEFLSNPRKPNPVHREAKGASTASRCRLLFPPNNQTYDVQNTKQRIPQRAQTTHQFPFFTSDSFQLFLQRWKTFYSA